MTRARDVANLIGSGNYSSTTFTATAGQTAFSISHTQGFVQVFMNGLLLDLTTDYTSNGSAITLTSGAAAGDEIEVVAYNTFSVGDALNQAAADTRYVNTTGDGMTGNLGVGGAANGSYAITSHSSAGQNLRFENDNEYAFFRLDDSGDLKIWVHGDDNLVFMNGTGSGTTQMNIDGSGCVTMPNQPSFTADMQGVTQYNMAGSAYTTISFGNEVFDQNSDYDTSTYTFTAPVTGRYMLGANLNYNLWDVSGNYVWMLIVTSNNTWYLDLKNSNVITADGYYGQNGCILADMDANDTAKVQIQTNGLAAQMDMINGTSSSFFGYLVA